ncbi:MAG TPA: VOC family protein [Pyrinomonadaceae bacterium]|nr:VOC family protein [Pyrinomonadaceae bacterium]
MSKKVVPMIHVPDVRATVDWYESIGFRAVATYGNERDGLSFAIVAFGDSQVMFNQGGETSEKRRREVDLYVYTDHVDDLYAELKDRVDIVEKPHNTFYGMREVIIRDLNRFWITFAEESAFGLLMGGVSESKPEPVRQAIASGQLKLETLNVALAVAIEKKNDEIAELLKSAGATPPPAIALETLQRYVGKYRCAQGPEVEIIVNEGKLFARPGNQELVTLWPLDQTRFKPAAFDGALVIFHDVGLTFVQDGHETYFQKS